jgi:hypothetical protein
MRGWGDHRRLDQATRRLLPATAWPDRANEQCCFAALAGQRAFGRRKGAIHRQFIWAAIVRGAWGSRDSEWNLAMKPLLIVLTAAVVLAIGGTLAAMNNACKSARHGWCASDIPQLRTAHRLAPCAGQAALPPVRSIDVVAPARRLCRGPDSGSGRLVFASPARLGR